MAQPSGHVQLSGVGSGQHNEARKKMKNNAAVMYKAGGHPMVPTITPAITDTSMA